MRAITFVCFKLEEKPIRSVEKNKNNFINIMRDIFAMSIRCGKSTISVCKTLFSCISYLRLFISNKISN